MIDSLTSLTVLLFDGIIFLSGSRSAVWGDSFEKCFSFAENGGFNDGVREKSRTKSRR